jgi:hypothetical protein
MATTTCSTDADIVLDTGQQLKFSSDINKASQGNLKDSTRVKAYNFINNKLRGRTAVPASHISGQVKEIEKDFVVGWLIAAGLTQERSSISEWSQFYMDRAKEALENITFPASASSVSADSNNTGDGTMTISRLNDTYTMTEEWEIVYGGNNWFYVYGTKSGQLISLELGEPYPDRERITVPDIYDGGGSGRYRRWGEYPFYTTITDGGTSFVQYDRFYFTTYSSSYKRKMKDFLPIVRQG